MPLFTDSSAAPALRAALGLAIVACALLPAGCDAFKVRIVEKSMEPTIPSGQLVSIDSGAFGDRDPRLGEIVSLRPPAGAERERCGVARAQGEPCSRPTAGTGDGASLIKRVVARAGQRVAIDPDGALVLDGVRQEESFTIPCPLNSGCALPRSVRVPAGHFFVLGDNRPYSSDSRLWGPVRGTAIEGKVEVDG